MIRQGLAMLLVLMGLTGPVRAEGDPLAEVMADDPARFLEGMTDLIAGFGEGGALAAAGIEDHIALERAAARASALRRFQAMDLDADGQVTRNELGVSQRAAAASSRGRLERQFAAADADSDGRIDGSELAAVGLAAALRAMNEEEAAILRSVLQLDSNGDGALTVDEVETALVMFEDSA